MTEGAIPERKLTSNAAGADAAPPVDYDHLNAEFYAGDPASYFQYRLNLLLLAAGNPDEVEAMLTAGVRYEGVVSQPVGHSTDDVGDAHLAYLITESQALLHHASEALARLFLAHADSPPSPWLEVARLREPSAFKAKAEHLAEPLWTAEEDDFVWTVFFGTKPEAPSGVQRDSHAAVTRLLKHLAKRLLQDSSLYNAVKHGMAVLSAETGMSLSDDETGASFGHRGSSVAFLEASGWQDRERTWTLKRRWVSIRQAMWLAQLAISEIDALWAVARARYRGAALDGVQAVTPEAVESGISGDMADRGGITSFSIVVAVEQRVPKTSKGGQAATKG
jgi:hypothetical protein